MAVAGVGVLAAFSLSRANQAARLGLQGKQALLRAESHLGARRFAEAMQDLTRAQDAFVAMRAEVRSLGPLRFVARAIPLVRVQLRAVEAYADAGELLARGGQSATEAAAAVLQSDRPQRPVSEALDTLRQAHGAVDEGADAMEEATDKVASVDGYRLFGPLDEVHEDLARRLPPARDRARAAEEGLAAFIAFAGGSGPRRYLVFTQNPDEPRPTGGYMGTYGVLSAAAGRFELERYAPIESWRDTHPQAVVALDQAPNAFHIPTVPVAQTIANANATADWPSAARLAMELWRRGGEAPVDGVVSFLPEFLARVVAVIGPVSLPAYGETITAANLVERLDYHTHLSPEALQPGRESKAILVDMARVVIDRLRTVPLSSAEPLARAFGEGFGAREAMAWSTDPEVQRVLGHRRWDATLPGVDGDFFYNAEFAYKAKNGRGIRRTFDHTVTVRSDGSALVKTRVTIRNTLPFSQTGRYNVDTQSYITVYGPRGARLHDSSDPPYADEGRLSGHPAAGWDRAAPPLGETSFTVAWDAPGLVVRGEDGEREYRLWWMAVPGHRGDVLRLRVELPRGWRWSGPAPPEAVNLDKDLVGAWEIRR